MVTHSSILAWRISWTEEPGGLQSLKSHFCIYIQRNWNHHLKEIPAPRIHCIVTQNTQNMEKTKGPSADEWVFFLLVLNACLCGVLLCIYFNWRVITLQYCCGFCHTFTWISHGYTCVPHPEPLPTFLPIPSLRGSSQCTSPEHPASCIEPGLAIYFTYDNIRFNAILSNHPTLTFSHRVQKSVLYSCSFAVSHIGSSLPSF